MGGWIVTDFTTGSACLSICLNKRSFRYQPCIAFVLVSSPVSAVILLQKPLHISVVLGQEK